MNSDLIIRFLAILVIGWGIVGMLQFREQGIAGYSSDGKQTVLDIVEASPADEAGLRPQDKILKVQGSDVTDVRALRALGTPVPGEQRIFEVDRGGDILEIRITYAAAPRSAFFRRLSSMLVGVGFVLFPLLARHRQPGPETLVLALMGLGLGLAFMGDPALLEGGWRSAALVLRHGLVLTGVAAGLHFLLLYPQRRRFLVQAVNAVWIYLPLVFYWTLLAWRILFLPEATGRLNAVTQISGAILIGIYFSIAVVIITRSFIRNRKWPAPNGPRLIFFGTLVGLLPMVLGRASQAIFPALQLPLQNYWFLTLLVIPLSWSFAATVKHTGNGLNQG